MKEKDLEQKVEEALRLFDLCQKQVARLNADCQEMMRDLQDVKDSVDAKFLMHEADMDRRKVEVEDVVEKLHKRLDKDKDDMLDKAHKKAMKLEEQEAASKACLLNLYECLSYVRKEAPKGKELADLKKQINALGK